jgi:hypothetical protein
MRRIALLCCMPLLAACSASLILGEPPSEKPRCPSQTGQSAQEVSPGVVLMAQSVRSASWLPCINTLPVGFSYERLDATNRGAHFWLNAGAEGTHAVRVALSRACDLRGADETTSERNGMRRYERIDDVGSGYRGEWFYVFRGGCVTYRFDLHGATGATSAATLSVALSFVSRATIAQQLHDYSGGRLDLDPTSPGGAQ